MNTSYWVGVEYSSQEDTFLDTEDEVRRLFFRDVRVG